jgi:hypothetical protein
MKYLYWKYKQTKADYAAWQFNKIQTTLDAQTNKIKILNTDMLEF